MLGNKYVPLYKWLFCHTKTYTMMKQVREASQTHSHVFTSLPFWSMQQFCKYDLFDNNSTGIVNFLNGCGNYTYTEAVASLKTWQILQWICITGLFKWVSWSHWIPILQCKLFCIIVVAIFIIIIFFILSEQCMSDQIIYYILGLYL